MRRLRLLLTFVALLLVACAAATEEVTTSEPHPLLPPALEIVNKAMKKKDCREFLTDLPTRLSLADTQHVFSTHPLQGNELAAWTYCRDGQRDTIFYTKPWVDFHGSPEWLAHLVVHEFIHLRTCKFIEAGFTDHEAQALSIIGERTCLGHPRLDEYGAEALAH